MEPYPGLAWSPSSALAPTATYVRSLAAILRLKNPDQKRGWLCPGTTADGRHCTEIRPAKSLVKAGKVLEQLSTMDLAWIGQLVDEQADSIDQILRAIFWQIICEDHSDQIEVTVAHWKMRLHAATAEDNGVPTLAAGNAAPYTTGFNLVSPYVPLSLYDKERAKSARSFEELMKTRRELEEARPNIFRGVKGDGVASKMAAERGNEARERNKWCNRPNDTNWTVLWVSYLAKRGNIEAVSMYMRFPASELQYWECKNYLLAATNWPGVTGSTDALTAVRVRDFYEHMPAKDEYGKPLTIVSERDRWYCEYVTGVWGVQFENLYHAELSLIRNVLEDMYARGA